MDLVSIEKALAENGSVLEVPVGHSMKPMLCDRKDAIVISRADRLPRCGEVILFRTPSGKCVLHRVVGIRSGGLVTRGDNCAFSDGVIPRERVLGILDGFYKGEKYVDCNRSKRYRLYVFYIRASYPFRFAAKGVRSTLSRLKKKVTGKGDGPQE